MRPFAVAALVGMLIAAPLAQAQTLPGLESISLTLNPHYPRPYEAVEVTVHSTLIDLAASDISFSINGAPFAEGSRTTGFITGGPGSRSVVTVTVVGPDGTSYVAEAVIIPADIALVMEAVSTAHPLYKGGNAVASQGQIRLIALPDFRTSAGTKIDPSRLSYTWRFGDKILQDASGLGKNVLTATAPVRYRDARITVTVATQDGSLSAEATRIVSASDPFVRIYRGDALAGPDFAHAVVSRFAMQEDEETFRAVPYFFAVPPMLSWALNGTAQGSDEDLTVRSTGNNSGTASLRVSARDGQTLLTQSAETGFTLEFGGDGGLGIFGL